jgi:IS5 family transposase
VTVTKTSGIIVGALAFQDNSFDGHTLPSVLSQVESIVEQRPGMAICDRGYRDKRKVGVTSIEIPESGRRTKTASDKRQARERFRRRAAIVSIFGHLKSDHRMQRNYLKGQIGDTVNLFMAFVVFNFRKVIRILCFYCLKLLGHVLRPNVQPLQACA